jgi:hypothetical protein
VTRHTSAAADPAAAASPGEHYHDGCYLVAEPLDQAR